MPTHCYARRAAHVLAPLCAVFLFCAGGAGANESAKRAGAAPEADDADPSRPVLKGKDAFGDWTTDAPGVRRLITVDDLPEPGATKSANNGPTLVPRPE